MSILYIIYCFFSYLIWGFAAFRQKGEKYFLFFLILISGDLLTFVLRHFFYSIEIIFAANFFYVISALLRLIAIQEKRVSKSALIFILILSVATVVLEIRGMTYKQEFALLSFFHFLFLFKFLRNFIVKLVIDRTINIFLACLIFYEITATTKYFGLITGFANAGTYLIITTVFELLIGIFFCIFKENSPRILIKLENSYVNS